MKGQRIVRIPKSGEENDCVLISVDQVGSSLLDLKLTGTEGLHPYVGSSSVPPTIQEARIDRLKAKSYDGTVDDWKAKIAEAFLLKSAEDVQVQENNSLQVVASVAPEKSITIIVRRDVAGITQRLGSVILDHNPEEAIELFDWASAATQSELSCRNQVSKLKAKSDTQEAALRKLRGQLHELIQAKNDHETILISKFRELLNAKKLKIRDQQRLLVKANIEGYREEDLGLYEVPTVISKTSPEDALKRRSKRKAKTSEPLPEPDEEKSVKSEERDINDFASPDRPGTESDESNGSDVEVSSRKGHNIKAESAKIAASSPVAVKEESQDSDRTMSDEDEL